MGHELVRAPPLDVSGSANRPPIDIRDRAALMTAFEGAEAVIHAAALHAPHMGSLEDAAFRSVNVEGTSCVLSAIATVGIRRMVFTSTTAVFGTWPRRLAARAMDNRRNTRCTKDYLPCDQAGCRRPGPASCCYGSCPLRPYSVWGAAFLNRWTSWPSIGCRRGIDPRDAAAAHLRALEYADFNAAPLIVSAQTPFSPSDCRALGISAEEVIEERCPGDCGSISNPWLVGAQTN